MRIPVKTGLGTTLLHYKSGLQGALVQLLPVEMGSPWGAKAAAYEPLHSLWRVGFYANLCCLIAMDLRHMLAAAVGSVLDWSID